MFNSQNSSVCKQPVNVSFEACSILGVGGMMLVCCTCCQVCLHQGNRSCSTAFPPRRRRSPAGGSRALTEDCRPHTASSTPKTGQSRLCPPAPGAREVVKELSCVRRVAPPLGSNGREAVVVEWKTTCSLVHVPRTNLCRRVRDPRLICACRRNERLGGRQQLRV